MYFAKLDARQNRLVEMRLVPLQSKKFRLNRASADDSRWLQTLLNRLGSPFGTEVLLEDDNSLKLRSGQVGASAKRL
jgi:poly-gamma-glutamate synthesis protein (capsule biosynthesis protein)